MNRGDVVLVDWLYSDMQGSKLRPAVVVQADFLNGIIDDTILVQFTGTSHGLPGTEVIIDPTVETSSGLRKVSYASCINLVTKDQAQIYQTLGYLSGTAMTQIEAALKTALSIP
jgi:mRNA-degrading endonuclease toxin of MazEF toxin-antitoxin module